MLTIKQHIYRLQFIQILFQNIRTIFWARLRERIFLNFERQYFVKFKIKYS